LQYEGLEDQIDPHNQPLRPIGADLRGADLSGFGLNDAKLFKGAVISTAQASMLLSEVGVPVA
jgi:hypothetical protein